MSEIENNMSTSEQWLVVIGLTIIGLLVGATWKILGRIGDVHDASKQAMVDHQKSDDAAFALVHSELRSSAEEIRKEVGESMTAIRQKITDVELWSRDNFVRRDSFLAIIEALKNDSKILRDDIRGFHDRLDAAFLRLEKKIEGRPSKPD